APLDVAVVLPRGFGDLLALGRQNRRELYSPQPRLERLVTPPPRDLVFEVAGRIDASGREVQPLDEAELGALGARIAATEVDAVAVCGLFSHLNPRHEERIAEVLRAHLPGCALVLSHRVAARPREYERFAAAVLAAEGRSRADELELVEPAPADGLDELALLLQGVADHMQQRLMQSARSSIAREAGDCAAALFLPDGRLIAQARWLPLLLGSLIPAVQAVLARFPAAQMAEGDGFLLNDPWEGGSHLPDLTLVVPLFHTPAAWTGTSGVPAIAEPRLMALAAVSLHHQDVGGLTPGSVPPHATSLFEEGLRVPPVQSHRHGQLEPTVRALLLANTRTPSHLAADLEAQWSSCELAARELAALWHAPGAAGSFGGRCQALLARTEALTRTALVRAPDGRHGWCDQLDSDGVTDQPVPLQVVLLKRGGELTIDFTGSASQTRGPVNASVASMMSAALFFMRTLAPNAPNNGGCLVPMTLVLPEGSVVNPRWPAAVNARTATVKLAANAMLSAWGREAAAVTSAAHAGVAAVLSVGGEDGVGKPFFFTEIIASGAGASAHGPGESGVSTDVGNARNTPVEVIEAQAPVRVEAYEIRRGSGGEGAFRGGDGVRRAWRLLHGRALLTYRGERHGSRAPGNAGGGAGAPSTARVLRADGRVEPLGPRARVELAAGDGWVIETAGGGGWGPAEAAALQDEPLEGVTT
ncbi:MAG: hydantoinase B/oxoprolinase family protein, partial [Rubrivivax sp.]|nr:hydantoinase B/oxoprolinase family protein [Rubrivivax sp.]